jgi:hypothetical protein
METRFLDVGVVGEETTAQKNTNNGSATTATKAPDVMPKKIFNMLSFTKNS